MFKWYVVQVMSGQENKVKKALIENSECAGVKELIEEILVPSENVSEVKKGQQRITEKRIWPGYILVKVKLTDEAWLYISNTNGVIGLLGGEHPVALSEEEVRQTLFDLEEKKKGVVQKHNLEAGSTVKITEGVFVNFTGTVLEVFYDKGKLSVLVSIFGRETRVDDLEFWQVEQVNGES